MKKLLMFVFAIAVFSPAVSRAQKQRFSTLDEALAAGSALAGRSGPRNVNWIEGGNRFSYIDRNVIKLYDPATGRDSVLFTGEGFKFPGTTQQFDYDAF